MEGCTVTPLHDYILKTEKLLDLERGEELDVISSTLTSRTLPELVASGSALSKLHVINVRTGMGHRKIVKFVKKVQEPYIPLPSHKFGSGDTVGISYSTNHEEYLCEGVVTKTTDVSLSVAVEHWDRDSIDVDSKTFCVLPTANDVTYKRMKSCLDALKEHKSKIGFALVEYLFGDRVIPFASSSPKPITSFFDTNLNSIQQEAVKRSTNNYRPIFVIHGPPGTGKTRTIVEVIRQAVEMGQKVLVCAPSNVAVDNIVERIGPYVKLIRIGHPARSHPSCAQYTLDSRLMHSDHAQVIKDIRNEMDSCVKSSKWRDLKDLRKELNSRENQATKQLLSSADVICSTLTSASVYGALRAIKDRGFDLVVVDECAQATELACWIPLLQSKRCILAGDHKQLPPTVISEEAAKQGFSQSLMERMEKEFSSIYSNELFIMLNVQYRMNENIMTWASNQMYYGKLIADQSVKDHSLRELLPCIDEITGSVLRFIDTDGCDMQEIVTSDSDSKGNVGEVKLVYILVKELIDCGCKQEFISIISPYNLQVNLLRQHVGSVYPHVTIRSVDGFQGQENEIMVLSLVRSNDKGEVGFLKDTRRMNVAVTRARRQLVIVGDSSTISKDVFIKSLVEHIELNGIINHANEFQGKDLVKKMMFPV